MTDRDLVRGVLLAEGVEILDDGEGECDELDRMGVVIGRRPVLQLETDKFMYVFKRDGSALTWAPIPVG